MREEFARIRAQIPEHVTLIAVSKTQPVEKIAELYDLGQRDFGENYAQELIAKATSPELRARPDLRWHFIGHLQSNKVKSVLPWITSVHSVDRLSLAQELSKRVQELGRPRGLDVFVEVNLDQESTKAGVVPEDAPELCAKVAALPGLCLLGLMAIPNPELKETDSAFERLRTLESLCRPSTQGKLSMGMSADYLEATSAGATHVRVGSALFGQRSA